MGRMEDADGTYPRRKVRLRLKVLSTVLIPFEVPEIGLQRKGRQQEVGLLSEHTLRVQDLLPQVPVIIIPGHSVTGKTQADSGRVRAERYTHMSTEPTSPSASAGRGPWLRLPVPTSPRWKAQAGTRSPPQEAAGVGRLRCQKHTLRLTQPLMYSKKGRSEEWHSGKAGTSQNPDMTEAGH